ncbi:MAG: DUF1801 domain-containing protein [Bacteroidia bacterium]|nr:DUF1801 domain-containing protein [Bacteroidia bacterium]
MQSKEISVDKYIESLPAERKEVIKQLRNSILKNLPKGFEECMSHGMIGYVVPHKLYPKGYHVDPKTPLPFMALASQKNFVALYHMGVYGDPKLLKWFTDSYGKACKTKLDMGKSCIRMKKMNDIPYDLIGELSSKLSPKQWIDSYESALSASANTKKKK